MVRTRTGASSDTWIGEARKEGLVSVIVPLFNREGLLLDALNSVKQQTYRPIEIVVVDDGSTDATAGIVKAWADAHADCATFYVQYHYQENAGAPAARNRGVAASSGAYVQYLDSDDLLLPHKIGNGVKLLQRHAVDMAYCKTRITNLGGEPRGVCGAPVTGNGWDIPTYSWHISGPLYRRRVVDSLGPWLEHLTGSQDWEYCVRAKLGSYTFHFDPSIGSIYRRHTSGRISKASFNLAYTRSTEQAYDHIWQLAERRRKDTSGFRERMARLYFYRALEYQGHGYAEGAARCLEKAADLVAQPSLVGWLIRLSRYAPHPWFARAVKQSIDFRTHLLDGLFKQ